MRQAELREFVRAADVTPPSAAFFEEAKTRLAVDLGISLAELEASDKLVRSDRLIAAETAEVALHLAGHGLSFMDRPDQMLSRDWLRLLEFESQTIALAFERRNVYNLVRVLTIYFGLPSRETAAEQT